MGLANMSSGFMDEHQHLMPDDSVKNLMNSAMSEDAQNMMTQYPLNDGNPPIPDSPGMAPYDSNYPMQNSMDETEIQSDSLI